MRHVMPVDMCEARRIAAMNGPTTRPAPCIAKTSPTMRPRDFVPEYSLMMVALTG